MREFMEKYEFLLLPVNQVLPFDVTTRYPTEIAGVKMENYIAWMKSTYYISIVGNPALSVPCGFTEKNLPVGLQFMARAGDDVAVIQAARTYQLHTDWHRRHPRIV